MGFLDDFGVDSNDIIAPSFKIAPEGRFFFEIGEAKVQKGTKNAPRDVAFIIEYQLSDADGEPQGSASERTQMKVDGKYTDRCKQSMGYLDIRLKALGFEGGLNDPDFTADNLVGLRGTLEVVHTKQGDRVYANVRNVKLSEDEDSDDNAYEDNRTETAKAADEESGNEPDEKPKRGAAAAARKAPRASAGTENPWD